MARTAKPKAVTAKMYGHFAVITLVVTASLGIFADGESREKIATEIASSSVSMEAPDKNERLVVFKPKKRYSWGNDDSSEIESSEYVDSASQDAGPAAARLNMGPSSQGLRKAKKKGRRGPGPARDNEVEAGPPTVGETGATAAQLDAMLEASRRRSGSEDPD